MAYASRAGRARISARNPQAIGVCDRCGIWYNHVNLRWQYDWRGASLQNLRLLVCNSCYDEPQSQLRAIVVPADPVPIVNPRIQDFVQAEMTYQTTSGQNTIDPTTGIPIPGGDVIVTQNNYQYVTQVTGAPNGSLNDLPGTDPNAVTYRNVSNAVNNGTGGIRLTLDTTNGMITGQNVIVANVGGVTNANGNFKITVVTSTRIDLDGSTFAGSYTSGGYVINNPSLPYGFDEVPETGSP